ncbi:PTS glucose transporter subunit IIA [Enterococcus gallinarum]|uniref:PTS glucose transporter subunit IIA n=1 Tax=Enterococcus gallinarum TaxID=1353 RepID=UPI001D17C10F|nr:PTS glucose transporter subunit IIA [Enterococcus gallinarum]MCC4045813.1 PTS glucose transporter subunit IIA [Enterococcus gallinarum]
MSLIKSLITQKSKLRVNKMFGVLKKTETEIFSPVNGLHVLLHVGLDIVALKGEGFSLLATEG